MKEMKHISFPLLRPVCLTPLSGKTQVELTTTGKVLISNYAPKRRYRDRLVQIASTRRATLSSSPKGLFLTAKIILPIEEATEKEFHNQVATLFYKAALGID